MSSSSEDYENNYMYIYLILMLILGLAILFFGLWLWYYNFNFTIQPTIQYSNIVQPESNQMMISTATQPNTIVPPIGNVNNVNNTML